MNHSEPDPIPAEFEHVAAQLRDERAIASQLELDAVKLRAMKQASQTRPGLYARQKGKLMKSRLALTFVIATGILMTTGGATMAFSGSSDSGSAAEQQYCTDGDTNCDDNEGTVLGSSSGGGPGESPQIALASDPSSLPFTGYAAIPLLIMGLGFVSVGVALRFKANRET